MSGPDGGEDGASESASDRSHEPDELPGEDNPGERLIAKYDPTVDGERPEEELATDLESADVAEETARLFWYLVAVFNVAILGLSVGVMVIVFLDRDALGAQITLAGAVLFAYGCYRCREHVKGSDEE